MNPESMNTSDDHQNRVQNDDPHHHHLEPYSFDNPLVFLEISIDEERVGRLIITLRKDMVPKAAENFRALCTGEKGTTRKGVKLHYKGTNFNTIKRLFMIQGGDVVNNDGSSGESIYGPTFSSEENRLEHTEGSVGMANFGNYNSNNSQFYITSVDCPQLDATNLIVGYVIRGLGILGEVEKYTNDDGIPTRRVWVSNCGEIQHGEDFGICDNDDTEDCLPPFVRDWDRYDDDFNVEDMLKILACIKEAGNFYYRDRRFVEAARKYKKAIRYYNYFMDRTNFPQDKQRLIEFHILNLLNYAAVELKLQHYQDVIFACNEVIKLRDDNAKAFFRRGVARSSLKLYEHALDDLKLAYKLSPDDKNILWEFERVKKLLMDYRQMEKSAFSKLFE